jgi:hypothetical protein
VVPNDYQALVLVSFVPRSDVRNVTHVVNSPKRPG